MYIKSCSPELLPTETFALQVLESTKYDNNPLINKDAIESAFNEYGKKLNPSNTKVTNNIHDCNLNIEGNFISKNIPEIPSIVIDKVCTKDILIKSLDKYDDITHIALTIYAEGMDNSLEIVQTIQSDFSYINLLAGGVGVSYPHIRELIPPRDICKGEGVNFLRKKFNLSLLSDEDFKIPKIFGNISSFPIPVKGSYLITQLGCLYNCDFCPSPYLYKYKPFSNAKKIIHYLENLCYSSEKDIFLFICDPNAFNPFQTWKKVFEYFIENPNNIDIKIFIFSLSSLHHLNKFDLETIQKKSPINFFLVNYGIESVINEYPKNKGSPKKVVERLNELNIITYQSFIIGLPFHTPDLLNLDVRKNLEYDSDMYFVSAYKPVPITPLYQRLKSEGRIFGKELPPEFLYVLDYMPFKHPYLGYGFDILKYCFFSYIESEKKTIDVYGKLSEKLLGVLEHTDSRKIKRAAKIFSNISQANFKFFQKRMPTNLSKIYENQIESNRKKISNL